MRSRYPTIRRSVAIDIAMRLVDGTGITIDDKVEWQGWKAIDAAERSRGSDSARPRVKFVSIDEMLATAKGTVGV